MWPVDRPLMPDEVVLSATLTEMPAPPKPSAAPPQPRPTQAPTAAQAAAASARRPGTGGRRSACRFARPRRCRSSGVRPGDRRAARQDGARADARAAVAAAALDHAAAAPRARVQGVSRNAGIPDRRGHVSIRASREPLSHLHGRRSARSRGAPGARPRQSGKSRHDHAGRIAAGRVRRSSAAAAIDARSLASTGRPAS